ncbi:MAG: hypothetical protein ACI83H_002914, partial [Glaciecola sp.]
MIKINATLLSSLFFLFFFTSCEKKENGVPDACAEHITPTTNHLISAELLDEMGSRRDTIEVSGEFQITSYRTSENSDFARCNQFYKGLPLFSNDVNFHFSNGNNWNMNGDKIDTVNISLEHTVSYTKAAEIAHDSIQSYVCYDATLGIYEVPNRPEGQEKEFVLIWKISVGPNGYPY